MSSIVVTPDIYTPNVSEEGKYVDTLTCFFPHTGILCMCTGRAYSTRDKFTQHTKCQRHIKWLEQLNLDNKNHFRRCMQQEQTIKQQRFLIAEMEKKLAQKTPPANLIDFLD